MRALPDGRIVSFSLDANRSAENIHNTKVRTGSCWSFSSARSLENPATSAILLENYRSLVSGGFPKTGTAIPTQ